MDPPTYLQQPLSNHYLDVYIPILTSDRPIFLLLSSSKLDLSSVLLQGIQSRLLCGGQLPVLELLLYFLAE